MSRASENWSLSPNPAPVQAVAVETPLVFAEVFRAHAPFAWRCLRRLGVATGDVDDVCQEVFLIVHKKLATYDGRASLRSWIYGICIRKASDHRRLAHVQRERLHDVMPESEAVSGGPEAALESRRALAQLDRALQRLDDDKRAAFVLYEIEGLGLQEVADACGCPLQTVYSRLAAARRHVEAELAERGAARGQEHDKKEVQR